MNFYPGLFLDNRFTVNNDVPDFKRAHVLGQMKLQKKKRLRQMAIKCKSSSNHYMIVMDSRAHQ